MIGTFAERRPTKPEGGRRLGVGLLLVAALVAAFTLGSPGVASAAGPTCPDGSTYNKKGKVCERNPTTVCPTGSSYDPASGLCKGEASKTCTEGLTYDPTADECSAPGTCPSGLVDWPFDSISCAHDPLGAPVGPKDCPTGSSLGGDGVCRAPAEGDPSCGPGLSYDSGRDACVAVPQYTCPQGYGYNVLTGKCQTAPTKGNTKT